VGVGEVIDLPQVTPLLLVSLQIFQCLVYGEYHPGFELVCTAVGHHMRSIWEWTVPILFK